MIVDGRSMIESLQTHPAEVSMAPCTRHMVTALRLLDVCLALRTRLHVVLLLPLGEQALVLVLRFDLLGALARALVLLAETMCADADQARRALHALAPAVV